jgi:hypothetical protein
VLWLSKWTMFITLLQPDIKFREYSLLQVKRDAMMKYKYFIYPNIQKKNDKFKDEDF